MEEKGGRGGAGGGGRKAGHLRGGSPSSCSVAALCECRPRSVGDASAGRARVTAGEDTGSQMPLPGSYLRPRDLRPPRGVWLEVRPSC